MDRVGARHQRRVQRVGHLGDDDEADEPGQHEDRQVGREGAGEDHEGSPAPGVASGASAPTPDLGSGAEPPLLPAAFSTAALAPWLTISPSRTTHAPAMTSS